MKKAKKDKKEKGATGGGGASDKTKERERKKSFFGGFKGKKDEGGEVSKNPFPPGSSAAGSANGSINNNIQQQENNYNNSSNLTSSYNSNGNGNGNTGPSTDTNSSQPLHPSQEEEDMIDENDYIRAHALYDYDPADEDEIPLRVGDVVFIFHKHESGWWTGEANGRYGIFPGILDRME